MGENQSPKKQKKPQQVSVYYQTSCSGFYSFIKRAERSPYVLFPALADK
jgi:hypothetical protein